MRGDGPLDELARDSAPFFQRKEIAIAVADTRGEQLRSIEQSREQRSA